MRVTVLPTPRSARVRGSAASNPGGTPEGPDADDEALAGHEPGHRLDGPSVPGLVRVTVVPAKSSGAILLVWILRTSSS